MKRNIKKASLPVIVSMLVMISMPAFAASEVTNRTTGSDSDNTASLKWTNTTDVDINNDADISNDVDLRLSTGGNSASDNTGDGRVTTGDATARVDITNGPINTVNVRGNGADEDMDFSFNVSNERTGSDSDNEAEVDITNRSDLDIRNDADIDNDVDCDAKSGDNEADDNTGDGAILTGDVACIVRIANEANRVNVNEVNEAEVSEEEAVQVETPQVVGQAEAAGQAPAAGIGGGVLPEAGAAAGFAVPLLLAAATTLAYWAKRNGAIKANK